MKQRAWCRVVALTLVLDDDRGSGGMEEAVTQINQLIVATDFTTGEVSPKP